MELFIAVSELSHDCNTIKMNITRGVPAESFQGLIYCVVRFWLVMIKITASVLLCYLKQLYCNSYSLNTKRKEQSWVHSPTLDTVDLSSPLLNPFVHKVLHMFPSASFVRRHVNRNLKTLSVA